MPRVYQRAFVLAALAALVACGRGAPSDLGAGPPTPRPEPHLLLATRSHELVAADGERALVDEVGIAGRRALEVPWEGGRPRPLLPATSAPHRVVAAFPRDARVLVELTAEADPAARLVVVDARGALSRLRSPGAGERFLGWSADGGAFRTAAAVPAGEILLETSTTGLVRRQLFAAPPPYSVVACDAEARRLVLARALDDESDEIVVFDRTSGDGRLLLPTAGDGRFRFLAWGAGRASAFFATDDGSDLPRLELIDLERGERRRFGALVCPPLAVRPAADGGWTVVIDCAGRSELVRLDSGGGALPALATPAGTRPLDALAPPAAGRLWLQFGGPAWPREVAALAADGDLRPRTYGLAPRLPPRAVPSPRPLAVRAAGVTLPARLWPATGAARLGVVWLSARTPRADELDPLAAALAAAGASTLRVVGRGADGFGRAYRRAADGDPTGAALADADAAIDALRRELPPAAPLTLVGEGPWWGAAALVVAARGAAGVARVVAIDPDPDPLAVLDRAPAPGDPARERLAARWGDLARPGLAAARESWRFPTAGLRIPAVVWLDAADGVATRLDAGTGDVPADPTLVVRTVRRRDPGAQPPELAQWLVASALESTAADAR